MLGLLLSILSRSDILAAILRSIFLEHLTITFCSRPREVTVYSSTSKQTEKTIFSEQSRTENLNKGV